MKSPPPTFSFEFIWRRGWDSNPRNLAAPAVFKTAAIDHSATSPKKTGKTLPEVDASIGSEILRFVKKNPLFRKGRGPVPIGRACERKMQGRRFQKRPASRWRARGRGVQVSTPSLVNANWPASAKEKMFWSERRHFRFASMSMPCPNVRKFQLEASPRRGLKIGNELRGREVNLNVYGRFRPTK